MWPVHQDRRGFNLHQLPANAWRCSSKPVDAEGQAWGLIFGATKELNSARHGQTRLVPAMEILIPAG